MLLLIVITIVLILVLFGGVYYFYYKNNQKNQHNKRGCIASETYTQCLENGNEAGKELKSSNNIPTPATTLKIKTFTISQGYPWCLGTRYALRYVDENGNYGPLSEWSQEIISQNKSNTCNSNVPQLVIKDEDGIDFSYPIINIHRQEKDLDGKWEAEKLVGMLLPYINTYIDIDNPNKHGIVPNCKGC